MNSESSELKNEAPSKELVQSLGFKEESPGVYVGGRECSGEIELSSLATNVIDPSEWDKKLDQVEAEAAVEANEQPPGDARDGIEAEIVGVVQTAEPVDSAGAAELVEIVQAAVSADSDED